MDSLSSPWFCLRSQIKHEHIAASHLRQIPGVEVFSPRIRFQRPTRQGRVWVTESLFPNYLFARFDPTALQIQVRYAHGISSIVGFGGNPALIAPEVISSLQKSFGPDELKTMEDPINPGDTVRITDPPFHGLEAVVTRVMPARERVKVLLEFLGRSSEVEVKAGAVLKSSSHPFVTPRAG